MTVEKLVNDLIFMAFMVGGLMGGIIGYILGYCSKK